MKPFSYQQKLISLPIHHSKFAFFHFLRYSIFIIRYSTFAFISLLRYADLWSCMHEAKLRHSIFIILYSIFMSSYSLCAQQQWTEPINISNLGGYSMDPDMVIDNNGVIHVVWRYQNSAYHWLILYTKSEDDGLTWTEPLDLLQNTDLWMLQPHIACDSKNKLYVTYTHDGNSWTPEGRLIKMLTYDGHQWSEPITVSEGMPGSNYSSIAINQNDKPYVFWFIGSQMGQIDMYYRYLIEDTWSDIYCPFCDSSVAHLPTMYSIEEPVMHWSGVYQIFGVEKPEYFIFDTDVNTWENPEIISQDTMVVDIDISLNTSNIPETAYRMISVFPPGIGFEGTMHTKKEGTSWLPPDLVSGTDKRQVGQQIAIDQNNDVHVVEYEYYNSSNMENMLVHYYESGNQWISQPIDSALHMINFPKMIISGNQLYVVYYKGEVVLLGDIWISKYDIVTNIKDVVRQTTELKIYPNPSQGDVYIEFENNELQHVNLSVTDMTGKHIVTLINEIKPPGVYRQLWKVTGKYRKENAPHLYLVRLQSGWKTVTHIVEIIK